MEHILYYNHPERGYGFHEGSPDFPESYKDSIMSICSWVAEPKPAAGNLVAFRYSPLLDRYLLSVIFRQPDGDGLQTRGVNTIVNFLMTAQEADQHFRKPDEALFGLESAARNLLRKYRVQAVLLPQQPIRAGDYRLPDAQLLNAATYAGIPGLDKQAFFAVEASAAQEVAAMLRLLPWKLRKQLSFHTGIQNARESIDVAVNLGTRQMMSDIMQSGVSGGQSNSKKYLYQFRENGEGQSVIADVEGLNNSAHLLNVLNKPPYPELTKPLLLDRVENWEQLQSLTALDCQNPMPVILDLIPEESLLQHLYSTEVSEETLHLLGSGAKDKRMKELKRAVQQLQQRKKPQESPVAKPDKTEPAANFGKTEKHPPLGRKWMRFFGKVLLTAAMVFGLVWLLKDIVLINILPQETVQLVISLTDAKLILKILGFTGLAMALSSWITYHITKWKYRK